MLNSPAKTQRTGSLGSHTPWFIFILLLFWWNSSQESQHLHVSDHTSRLLLHNLLVTMCVYDILHWDVFLLGKYCKNTLKAVVYLTCSQHFGPDDDLKAVPCYPHFQQKPTAGSPGVPPSGFGPPPGAPRAQGSHSAAAAASTRALLCWARVASLYLREDSSSIPARAGRTVMTSLPSRVARHASENGSTC